MNEDWVNDWYLLGAISDVADGTVSLRSVGPLDLAVFNIDGEIIVARDACDECSKSLAGACVQDDSVECRECGQRHRISSRADATTDHGSGLAVFPVMLVDDEIFAWIENLS